LLPNSLQFGKIMRYFKKKDGSVIGKMDSVSEDQVAVYLDDGCKECDVDGKEMKSESKPKKKK